MCVRLNVSLLFLTVIAVFCVWLFFFFFIAYLGTLEFNLLFDQENNCLHCTIHKAKVRAIVKSSL